MAVHKLKSWPEYFDPVVEGRKTFELRRNDRKFAAGDILILQEWEPRPNTHGVGTYTGRTCLKRVCYVMDGLGHVGVVDPLKGLHHGYSILGLADVSDETAARYVSESSSGEALEDKATHR